MKMILFLGLLLLGVGCSNSDNVDSGGSSISQDPVELSDIIHLMIDTNNELDAETVSFKMLQRPGTGTTKKIEIENQTGGLITIADLTTQIEALDDLTADANSLKIRRDRCSGKNLNNGDKCLIYVKVLYNPDMEGTTPAIDVTTANPSPKLLLLIDTSESYQIAENNLGSSLVKSSEILNFGHISEGELPTRRIYISNINTIPVPSPSLPTSFSDPSISVLRNTCSGDISAGSACLVDFQLSFSGSLSGTTVINETINFTSDNMVDKTLEIQAVNLESVDPNATKLTVTTTDFPQLSLAGRDYYIRYYFSNATKQPYIFGSNDLNSINLDPLLSIARDTCSGRTLAGSTGICYVDVRYSPTVDNESTSVNINIPIANLTETILAGSNATPKYNNGVLFESKGAASSLDGKDPAIAGTGNRDDILAYQLTSDDIKDVDVYNKKFQALNEELNSL